MSNTVPDALAAIIRSNSFLQAGLHSGLFNLTKVATFVRPQVEARVEKKVRTSAILMALSRLNRTQRNRRSGQPVRRIRTLSAKSGLAIVTFPLHANLLVEMARVRRQFERTNGYMVFVYGLSELAVIIETDNINMLRETVSGEPLREKRGIACIGFDRGGHRMREPGLFHFILQQLEFQGISVTEIASTATGLMIYLDQQDLRLAFSTLCGATSLP